MVPQTAGRHGSAMLQTCSWEEEPLPRDVPQERGLAHPLGKGRRREVGGHRGLCLRKSTSRVYPKPEAKERRQDVNCFHNSETPEPVTNT